MKMASTLLLEQSPEMCAVPLSVKFALLRRISFALCTACNRFRQCTYELTSLGSFISVMAATESDLSADGEKNLIEHSARHMVIVDDILKRSAKNRLENAKRKQIERFVGKLLDEIEDELHVPIGRFFRPNERFTPNYPAVFSNFDPIFETTDWGGPSSEEVKNVLLPVYDVLWDDFDVGAINEEIALFRGEPHPYITLTENNSVLRQRIRLAVRGTYYQQHTYQFAHELTHLLTNYEERERESQEFLWLTEMFAELGSAYVLIRFSLDPPYAPFNSTNWSSYYNAIYGRLNDQLASRHGIQRYSPPTEWLDLHIRTMQQSSVERELNWGVARHLLPQFLVDPTLWAEAGVLYQWDTSKNGNLHEFLDSWERTLEKRRMDTKLISLLSKSLPNDALFR